MKKNDGMGSQLNPAVLITKIKEMATIETIGAAPG